MKNLALMPLHSYKMKLVGILFSVISIVLMVIISYVDNFSLISEFDKDTQFYLFLWVNGAALFTIAFSREKVEDERISMIRGRTFITTAGGMFATLLAFSFVSLIYKLQPIRAVEIFPFLTNFFLIFHLLVFYFRIYFNVEIPLHEVTVMQNIRNNKRIYIIYVIIYIVGAILLLLV